MRTYLLCLAVFFSAMCTTELKDSNEISFEAEDVALIFADGFISTGSNERDMAISPDGQELYFTLVAPKNHTSAIMYCTKQGQGWSSPELAPFSGKFKDLEPAFSPDGDRLFFVSNRTGDQDTVKSDMDIWYVDREDESWAIPSQLDTVINTSENEYYPSVAQNGNLYFTATYPDSKGREDIYVSFFEDGKYNDPVSLDTSINSASYEFNCYVAPDESYIIFSSYGRPDGKGGGDLYISYMDQDGGWSDAEPMTDLNSRRLDYSPFVWADSLMFFTSERTNFDSGLIQQINGRSFINKVTNPANGNGDLYITRLPRK